MSLLGRLRTQLILSHLAAIAFTLVAMVAAVVLIAGSWFASQQQGSLGEPAQQARLVASTIGGLVLRGEKAQDVNVVLRLLATGGLGLPAGSSGWGPPSAPASGRSANVLHDVAYIVVVGPDGQLLATSDSPGAEFAPAERARWEPLIRAALQGSRDPRQMVSAPATDQPVALGSFPILDDRGQPIAAVVVAMRVLPLDGAGVSFWHNLLIFGAASAAVLAAASVFALLSASVVGYVLSRRLVRRLELLGRGVEALAAGDLARRVEEGGSDEVGQLARRFNAMAEWLASTVAELATAKEHAEAALRAKRELVANVSHELRTPLALIRSHVEAIQRPGREADSVLRRTYLTIVERETENLSRLVDDLFALSTAEAGTLPFRLEPVSVADVIAEVADSIRPLARRERQITIVTDVPPNLPPARTDRQRVVQVLGNLTRNALRYTPEGGLIALRAARQDGLVVVSVEDTGEGIAPESLPHVFERFYRGDAARDRASGGAGLGLAIVRELVEAMGGEVAVESIVGQGSRFMFRLPLAGEPTEATLEAPGFDEPVPNALR